MCYIFSMFYWSVVLFGHRLGLTADQVHFGLPEMDVSGTRLTEVCPSTMELPCEPHKYRALSGHCNNVQNPHWGTAGSRYVRFLPPDYADGVSLPRGTVLKKLVPMIIFILNYLSNINAYLKFILTTITILTLDSLFWYIFI